MFRAFTPICSKGQPQDSLTIGERLFQSPFCLESACNPPRTPQGPQCTSEANLANVFIVDLFFFLCTTYYSFAQARFLYTGMAFSPYPLLLSSFAGKQTSVTTTRKYRNTDTDVTFIPVFQLSNAPSCVLSYCSTANAVCFGRRQSNG